MTQVCHTKEQFKKNQDKLLEVNNRKGELQAKIEPIQKKFEFIMDDNYSDIGQGNFELTEDDKMSLQNIGKAWERFQLGMSEAKDVLRKCHTDFKQQQEENIDEFKREVTENRENFKRNAPFQITKENEAENNKKAFEMIQFYHKECKSLRQREESMQFGLEIFMIEPTNYVDLALVEKENAMLNKIWEIKQEWDHQWDRWKVINFRDLNIKEMEEEAGEI